MEYRTLPHTDLKASRLSFGTMPFGSQSDEAASCRMVDCCLAAGINFFDTANMYNLGKAETVLGKALAGKRQQVILASKVRFKMGEGPDESGLSRAAIRTALDASLKRLGTDYLDLYYLHYPDYDVPIEETFAALDEAARAGKVRYPAVSNYAGWQLCEILWICEKNGFEPPYVSQPMYNLLARGIEEEYLPFCKQFGVAVIPYNPLAGGLLTGKHSRAGGPIAGTRFDNNQLYLGRYWHDDYFDAVEELRTIAREAGKTLNEMSATLMPYDEVWNFGYPLESWPRDTKQAFIAAHKNDPTADVGTAWKQPRRKKQEFHQHAEGTEDHIRNFFECVRSRQQPVENVDFGCGTAVACHMANISYREKKRVFWDAANMQLSSET